MDSNQASYLDIAAKMADEGNTYNPTYNPFFGSAATSDLDVYGGSIFDSDPDSEETDFWNKKIEEYNKSDDVTYDDDLIVPIDQTKGGAYDDDLVVTVDKNKGGAYDDELIVPIDQTKGGSKKTEAAKPFEYPSGQDEQSENDESPIIFGGNSNDSSLVTIGGINIENQSEEFDEINRILGQYEKWNLL